MDNNVTLTVENFEGRLNLAGFTNIEKGYSSEEFSRTFTPDKYRVFEEANVQEFIKSINKAVGGEIIKGGFNDTDETKSIIEKAKNDLSGLRKVRINDGPGTIRNVYVQEIVDQVTKGEENDLEKSHVTDAFAYGQNKITFKKKGSEIKDKMAAEKARIERENEDIENKIEDCREDFVCNPTQTPSMYGARERVKCPYKVFNWNQTYYSSTDNGMNAVSAMGEGDIDCQPCGSPEEAECNSKYNQLVYDWIDNCAEIFTLELYENNIEDNKSYELTAEQMLSLKF